MTEKYTNFLKIRITDLEKKTFLLQSEIAGISISELIRRQIRDITIISKSDRNLLNELRRQGGLFKHSISVIRQSELADIDKRNLISKHEEILLEIQFLIQKISTIFNSKEGKNEEKNIDS